MKTLFYENDSGEIFTDYDIKKAFSIIYGISYKDNECKYLRFLDDLLHSSITFIPNITVEYLAKKGKRIHAASLYSEIHGCSIKEADEKVRSEYNEQS